jgi:hypothetical protein
MFSTLGKFTAASLVAGAAFGFAALPADAQTMPRSSVFGDNVQTNVVEAQYRGGRHYRSGRNHYRGGYRHGDRRGYRHGRHYGPGIGFGLGFGLGLALPHVTSPYYSRPYAYAAPTPYASGALVPGSAAWIQYCSQKYNSFNPATGTYLAYSGVVRPCRVP